MANYCILSTCSLSRPFERLLAHCLSSGRSLSSCGGVPSTMQEDLCLIHPAADGTITLQLSSTFAPVRNNRCRLSWTTPLQTSSGKKCPSRENLRLSLCVHDHQSCAHRVAIRRLYSSLHGCPPTIQCQERSSLYSAV